VTRDDDGWYRHVRDRVERLPFPYFRELVVDVWGLRGFDVAGGLEDERADFVGVRGSGDGAEVELVAVHKDADADDAEGLAEASEGFGATRAVAVAKRFDDEERARGRGAETVDADRLAGLVHEGGFLWALYRWVALSEADEPDVIAETHAPARYGEVKGVEVGRTTSGRLGADGGDIVRVAGEAAGFVRKGGVFETDRDYVRVDETYREAVDTDEGDVSVELLGAGEARRAYVLSVPSVNEELAAELWQGHAPHKGAELSQTYTGDGVEEELRTMALEVLPRDYSAVTEDTDVVVEGYAGARRVFE